MDRTSISGDHIVDPLLTVLGSCRMSRMRISGAKKGVEVWLGGELTCTDIQSDCNVVVGGEGTILRA